MDKINFLKKTSSLTKILIITILCLLTEQNQVNANAKDAIRKLQMGTKLFEFRPDFGLVFIEQNPSKIKLIRSILSKFGLSEQIILDTKSNNQIHYLSLKKKIHKPQIEFRKINSTKYRLRIHKANGNFPLIFSEKFNDGWKAYLLPWKAQTLSDSKKTTFSLMSNYKILEGNEKTQASLEELKNFLSQGWITDLENKYSKEITLHRLITSLKSIESPQKFHKTDYISKNYLGSIQNNNLPANNVWETWFARETILNCNLIKKENQNCSITTPLISKKKQYFQAIQLPDLLHWQINSFANSWWIELEFIRQFHAATDTNTGYYQLNSDGSIDFEVVLEFWPQRSFYMWGIFSIIVFCLCLVALFFRTLLRFFASESTVLYQNSGKP